MKTKQSIIIMFLLATLLPGVAQVYLPSQMPNVQVANRAEYVSDPAGLLPADVKSEINARLATLRSETSVEAVLVIPPEIGDMEPSEWCEKLFSDWKIGKRDKDNGLLMMISPGSRCAFIMTGYGLEGVLPDIACKKIVNQAIIPAMKEGDLAGAALGTTNLVFEALTDPAVAEELRSSQSDSNGSLEPLGKGVLWNFIWFVAITMFILEVAIFIHDARKASKRKSNYSKAERWRGHLGIYFWAGVFSMGAGLIFWLIALFMYRRWRTKRIKCPNCGVKMKRLSEKEDNEFLNDAQDFEEQLKTVDYDVWQCPDCGTLERIPYNAQQKKYTKCPKCQTVAMCLVEDIVLNKPTTRSTGNGKRIYECKYCHHREEKIYKIPRKEEASAVAGAVLGAAASSSRSSGGGGGFGGGFGGGRTGGGGAGGRW